MEGSISPTSPDLSKIVDLATLCTLPPIGQALSWWMSGTSITTTLLCRHFDTCLQFSQIVSLSPCYCLYLFKLFYFVLTGYNCGLGSLASTLLSQRNRCSLVTAVYSSALVNSLIISASISLSLGPCMNHSFNCLSIFL